MSTGKRSGPRVRTTRRRRAAGTALAAALALTGCSGDGDAPDTAGPPPPKTTPTTLPAQDAGRLQVALGSKNTAAAAAVLAPEIRGAYLKQAGRLLSPGSKLTLQSAKMTVSGETATVPATVTGGADAGTYLLVLRRQGDQWLLVGTRKQ